MRCRIPAARSLGRARLAGWVFVCNKSGMDGSAKANVEPRRGAVVWGVVYELPTTALEHLDVIEGGYERIRVTVVSDEGRSLPCWTYTSERRTHDQRPFPWYRAVMVEGAEEHQLPPTYVATLRSLVVREAPAT